MSERKLDTAQRGEDLSERAAGFLTGEEWWTVVELFGIVLFATLLLLAHIAFNYPAGQFIYGRF